jgi:hypothetical protein
LNWCHPNKNGSISSLVPIVPVRSNKTGQGGKPFLLVSKPSKVPNLHLVDLELSGIDFPSIYCLHDEVELQKLRSSKSQEIDSAPISLAFGVDALEKEVDMFKN